MRAIAAIVLLFFISGCGETNPTGPTRAELIVAYEAELRESERIESELVSLRKESLELMNGISTGYVFKKLELEKQKPENLDTKIKEMEAQEKIEIKRLEDLFVEKLKDIKPRLAAQKLRVEAAKKAKDAAGE